MAGLLYPLSGGAVGLDSSLSMLEATIPREALPVERPRANGKEEEEENDENLPMVFLCGGCKRPVGDTLSWVANDEETECILLRSECRSHALTLTAAVGDPWSPLPSAQVPPATSRWTRSRSCPSGLESVDGERP